MNALSCHHNDAYLKLRTWIAPETEQKQKKRKNHKNQQMPSILRRAVFLSLQ